MKKTLQRILFKKKEKKQNKNSIEDKAESLENLGFSKENEKKGRKEKSAQKNKLLSQKTIIIASIIILVAIITITLIRAKITFFTNDELVLSIEPLDYSFNIINDDVASANFTITNKNFIQCQSFCELSFIDLKSKRKIYYENITLKHNAKIKRQYNMTSEKYGSGQKLFSLDITCNNLKSLVCYTDEEKRYYSVLILLNYDVSDKEKEMKENVAPKINKTIKQLNETKSALYMAKELVKRISNTYSYDKTLKGITDREEKIIQIEKRLNESITYFEREEYSLILNKISENDDADLNTVKEELTITMGEIQEQIRLRNTNINNLAALQTTKQNLSNGFLYYLKEMNLDQWKRLTDVLKSLKEIYNSYSAITNNLLLPEDQINTKILDNSKKIGEFIDLYNYEKKEGLFLSMLIEMENSIKNNKTFYGSSLFVNEISYCDFLKSKTNDMKISNQEANKIRTLNYGWTLNETIADDVDNELKMVEMQIREDSLVELYSFVNNSNMTHKDDFLLEIKDIQRQNDEEQNDEEVIYDYLSNMTELEKNSIANISTTQFEQYIANYCKNDLFNNTVNTSESEKYFSTNFESILSLLKDAEIPKIALETYLLKEGKPICCVYGECKQCCDAAPTSCKISYPVLYVHGHAFDSGLGPETVMNGFSKMQEKLRKDGFIDAGRLDVSLNPADVSYGDWGRYSNPFVMSASYYYISYYSLGAYSITAQNNERIENYAIRLKEIINLIKYRTGSDKVDIVAHSMGGLVIREYLYLFGDLDIGRIITLNTPHQGISGNVRALCGVMGAEKECEDMYSDSIFLSKIEYANKDKRKDMYVIRSLGCNMENNTVGDGIVTNDSGYLLGANNIVNYGKCTDALNTNLHVDALDPDKYPKVYEIVRDILLRKENISMNVSCNN